MSTDELTQRQLEAAEEFNFHEGRHDGERIASQLGNGLTFLRDVLYHRVHDDVERLVGMDSMLAPVSQEKTERITKTEVEIYQIVVSVAAVESRGYVSESDWYLDWLTHSRLGHLPSESKTANRLAYYLSRPPERRRLAFTNILSAALPESRQAPLVLFLLHPMAVEIATAVAFGDGRGAAEIRRRQIDELPAIPDCPECHGRLLETAEQCRVCGNPLWKYAWLTATV